MDIMVSGFFWSKELFEPIADLLVTDYCYSHAAGVQVNCSSDHSEMTIKAKLDKGYPPSFQMAQRSKTTLDWASVSTKLASSGLCAVETQIAGMSSIPKLTFQSQFSLAVPDSWGKHRGFVTYPHSAGKLLLGINSTPSLLCSFVTPNKQYGVATDIELNLRKLTLTEYYAAAFWSTKNWFFCLFHESTDSAVFRIGHLSFAYKWNISERLKLGGQLLYQGKSNQLISTAGFSFHKDKFTVKGKLNSEGFVSITAKHTLKPGIDIETSTHFDAKNLQGFISRESLFGFRLILNPT